jgi:hypothetical protein
MSKSFELSTFSQWLRRGQYDRRPWLLAGPAASPELVEQAAAEGFAVLAADAAASGVRSDVALVVDLERLASDGEAICARASTVVVPNDLHVSGWAQGRSLESWADEVPLLRRLADEGRLISFDLWTSRRAPGGPVTDGDWLGEELPLRLLTTGGVKMARHLGFRRGLDKVGGFEACQPILAGSAGSLAQLKLSTGVSYGPYGYPVPARIFAGSDDEQLIGVRVLHYSILQHSTMDVVVEPLDWKAAPVPVEPKNRSKTGFSFCRFDIPRLCGYSGRGVYVDADMQVFADITDLWTLPLDEADLLYSLTHPTQGRSPQTSVMLLNCETLAWDIHEIVRGLDEGRYSYKALMSELCIVPEGRAKPLLPYWWNSLELYEPGRTSLIHYTDMQRQPWISDINPNGHHWYRTCAEAIERGFIDTDELSKAVELGHVSPEIYGWLGLNSLPDVNERAATWIAPFNRFLSPRAPEGAVALTDRRRLVGWAWDPARPDEPIELGIYDEGKLLFSLRPAEFGPFLAKHGKGNGRHAFNVELPPEVMKRNAHQLSVRIIDPKVELKGSPVELYR